jgi:5-methylcytosine-specific restriction endonuclease McrA
MKRQLNRASRLYVNSVLYKRCTLCKLYKEHRDMVRKKTSRDGCYDHCKHCHREATKKQKGESEEYQEYLREYNRSDKGKLAKRKWKEKNPETVRQHRRERRHRNRGAEYDKSVDRLSVWKNNLGLCHICVQPVTFEESVMEHVIPLCLGGGWTWANMRPAHGYCNARKGKETMEQLEARGVLAELRNTPRVLALTSGQECGIMKLEGQNRREPDGILGVYGYR